MFSQLGPLFKTTFRQAENADARLEIRREEKEHQRKKDDAPDDAESNDALWQDSMDVSIDALRTFLLEFLRNHGAQAPAHTIAVKPNMPQNPETRPPISSTAAKAAKAYGSMYAQTHTPSPIVQTSEIEAPDPDNINPADLLEASEIREIHALIADLDQLSKMNVQTLAIVMNGTFLESLSAAVRALKSTKGF